MRNRESFLFLDYSYYLFIFISRSAAIGFLNTNKFGSTKHIFKQLSLSTLK